LCQTPREQFKQYVADLQKNPADNALRQKIIKLALSLDPKPLVPPEVYELVGRAKYAIEHASSTSDFASAADTFGRALLPAPWISDYYFNQGVAYEKAQKPDAAIACFRWYLTAAPDAQDANAVRERIGGLKYQVEKQQAADAAARAQQEAELDANRRRDDKRRESQAQEDLLSQELNGSWIDSDTYSRSPVHFTFRIENHMVIAQRCADRSYVSGIRVSEGYAMDFGPFTFQGQAGSDGRTMKLEISGDSRTIIWSELDYYHTWQHWATLSRVNNPRLISPKCR
jgi:tetratricopeptide (TPR) repeat protein